MTDTKDTAENMRRAGRAELDRLNAQSKKTPAGVTPKKRPRYKGKSFGDVVGIGKAKEPRHRGESVDEAVDKAVSGAKLSY